MRRIVSCLAVASVSAAMLFVAPRAQAQESASLVGLVRDTSGAAMPGATVEATSPVLIEKVRSAVSGR